MGSEQPKLIERGLRQATGLIDNPPKNTVYAKTACLCLFLMLGVGAAYEKALKIQRQNRLANAYHGLLAMAGVGTFNDPSVFGRSSLQIIRAQIYQLFNGKFLTSCWYASLPTTTIIAAGKLSILRVRQLISAVD